MRYFAKYLPDDTKLKKGDTVLEGKRLAIIENIGLDTGIPLIRYLDNNTVDCGDFFQKVALFICSKDDVILDYKFMWSGDDINTFEITTERKLDVFKFSLEHEKETRDGYAYYFTVIGKVSPDAIWVKEGDEFNDEDLGIRLTNHHGDIFSMTSEPFTLHNFKQYNRDYVRISVKGTCGHFH